MMPEFPVKPVILQREKCTPDFIAFLEQDGGMLSALSAEGAKVHQDELEIKVILEEAYGGQSIRLALGLDVRFENECTSTQTMASNPNANETLFVADYQSAGRGRLGRKWLSDPGQNILLSMRLSPEVDNDSFARCSLLWSAAIAKRLNLFVKWPNDIVTESGQKVGGILSTLEHNADKGPVLIFGIGLNISQDKFDGVENATSLTAVYGEEPSRMGVLLAVVEAIKSVDVNDTLDLWRSRAPMLGKHVQVAGHEGIAVDVREDGALQVGDDVVLSGDVELIEVY